MNTEHSHITQQVLEKVRTGGVQMHSRAYFIARVVLSVIVAGLTLTISALVGSFIFFSIHLSGHFFLLGYGARGVQTFILLFPWALLALDVALIIALQWLLQGFRFGYRASLLVVFLWVLGGSVALAAVINVLPVNSALLERADRGELPLVGGIYMGVHDSHRAQGVFRGVVISTAGPTSTIIRSDRDRDIDDGQHVVVTGPETKLDAPLHVGDQVYIFGTDASGTIEAEGIDHLSE